VTKEISNPDTWPTEYFNRNRELKGNQRSSHSLQIIKTSLYFHKPSHRCRRITFEPYDIQSSGRFPRHYISHQNWIGPSPRGHYHFDLLLSNHYIFIRLTSRNTKDSQSYYILTTHRDYRTRYILSGTRHI
jgi:hypothetical protein